MTNRSKQIGTAGETAVVKYLQGHGFGLAERRALKGSHDVGDILVCPGVIAEVKAGMDAKNFQQGQLQKWQEETRQEHENAAAEVAMLIVQRRGFGPDRAGWWWTWLYPNIECFGLRLDHCWTPLWVVTSFLRHNGWGDPL